MTDHADDMITLTGDEVDAAGAAAPRDTADQRPTSDGLVITHNADNGTYEATIGGRTAAGLVYDEVGNRATLLATSVLPEFRGQGIAAQLTGYVLDELRRQGKTATIACPFAAAFVNGHPEYADVLDPELPGPRITSTGH